MPQYRGRVPVCAPHRRSELNRRSGGDAVFLHSTRRIWLEPPGDHICAENLTSLPCTAIAKKLTEPGIKSPAGNDVWHNSTVKSFLSNEKYKGCALLQKGYTQDYLTRKYVKNDAAVPQYNVEGSRPGVNEPEVFNRVQDIMDIQSRTKSFSGCTIFSSRIRCGCCGGWFGSKVWHSTDRYRRVIWQCIAKYKGVERFGQEHDS